MMTTHDAIQALFEAVDARDLETVRRLLDEGVSVDGRHPWIGGFALHRAVSAVPDLEILRVLLQAGPQIDRRHEETGGTALHQLLHADVGLPLKLQALDLLLEHGADVNSLGEDDDGGRYTAVDIARMKCDEALVRALIERGGQPGPDAG